MSTQRNACRAGQLSQSQTAALESLPGWEWALYAPRVPWEDRLRQLSNFHARHDRMPLSTAQGDELTLVKWLQTQRSAYGKGTLQPDRIAALESLPFWDWGTRRTQQNPEPWEDRLGQLVAFHAEHKRMPLKTEPMYHWVSNQRHRHQQGKLPQDRIAALEALPFWEWTMYGPHGQFFAKRLAALREANDDHTPAMKAWIQNQKRLHRNGKLSAKRVALLEAVPGWTWQLESERRQLERLEAVRCWYNRYDTHPDQPTEVGATVHRFRAQYRKERLPPEMIAELEAIPGWVWRTRARPQTVAERLTQVRDWYEVNDQHPASDSSLGRWVKTQRVSYGAGLTDPTLAAELEAIDGWEWDAARAKVERHLKSLRDWHATNDGHPPQRTALGTWAARRRRKYKTGELSDERVAELEAIPGWVWDTASQS